MAAINVKISDDLKDQGDSVLRENGLNATQYITHCWQYLALHGRLPFITETRVLTPRDAIAGLAGQFSDALVRLQAVGSSLLRPGLSAEGLAAMRQEMRRLTSGIRMNGLRLEAEPELDGDEAAGRHLLPGVNYHLESCVFALDELRLLPDGVEGLERFESALQAFADRLTVAQAVLRDAGVLPRPEPASEFIWRGENVTMAFTQPRPAAPGAWFVRITARTAAAEQRLEELPLAFPDLKGTGFLPGSVYGRIVRSPLTGASDTGFTFLDGYCEFYLCHDETDADAPVPVSGMAAELAAVVDAAVLRRTGRE